MLRAVREGGRNAIRKQLMCSAVRDARPSKTPGGSADPCSDSGMWWVVPRFMQCRAHITTTPSSLRMGLLSSLDSVLCSI